MHIEHNTNKRRLSEWDYSSPGMYFVTFCTYEKKRILGSVRSETMHLSKYGMACKKVILENASSSHGYTIEKYVIMPNHIHLLIQLSPTKDASLGNIIGYLKSAMTKSCHSLGFKGSIWQISFHDHIVRNPQDLERIYEYITNNPKKWELDCMYTSQ